jgi:hypothetical protein
MKESNDAMLFSRSNSVVVLLIISQNHSKQNTFVIPKLFRTAKFSLL